MFGWRYPGRGRPRGVFSRLPEKRKGPSLRTHRDDGKAILVMGEVMRALGLETDDDIRRRLPKYWSRTNREFRVTVLRHFAPPHGSPELVDAVVGFHERDDWTTAREAEALIKEALGLKRRPTIADARRAAARAARELEERFPDHVTADLAPDGSGVTICIYAQDE